MRARVLRLVGLGAWIVASVVAPPVVAEAVAVAPGEVSVRYQLLTAFEGTEQAGGRIIVFVTNRSAHALAKVTLRLADPAVGRITGPVQEGMALAAGETRQVEGDFIIDVARLHSTQPLDWIVVYTEAEGFAKQIMVRGEALPGLSMDADARTTNVN